MATDRVIVEDDSGAKYGFSTSPEEAGLPLSAIKQIFPRCAGLSYVDDGIKCILTIKDDMILKPADGWSMQAYQVVQGVQTSQSSQRIKDLISIIRKRKADQGPKVSAKSAKSEVLRQENNALKRPSKLRIGWLHFKRSSFSSRIGFKHVTPKEGGGIRELSLDTLDIDVDTTKEKAAKLFFQNSVSPKGNLEDMEVEFADVTGKTITQYSNTDGEVCTLKEYLKSKGFFPSRTTFFLKTRSKSDTELPCNIAISQAQYATSQDKMSNNQTTAKKETIQTGNNLFDSSKVSLTKKSTSIDLYQPKMDRFIPVLSDGTISFNENKIYVTYCQEQTSSFCEVITSKNCYSRRSCFEFSSSQEPELLNSDEPYDPIKFGFFVKRIRTSSKVFLDTADNENEDAIPTIRYVYPAAESSCHNKQLILFGPSDIWGYDEHELILGLVMRDHGNSEATYTWRKNGEEVCNGSTQSVISVRETGVYTCEVKLDTTVEVSNGVQVVKITDAAQKTEKETDEKVAATCFVPDVKKEDIEMTDIILGEGAFGKVTKGMWAGSSVAIKFVSLQKQRKHIKRMVEKEIQVHARVRHLNIVQLMAISCDTSGVYLLTEFVDGVNMEDAVFDDEIRKKLALNINKKMFVAKQTLQAVAYMHAMHPPIIHRDIKPGNILITNDSLVTKLCDLGVSRVKSLTTLTCTRISGCAPGTPAYMAPECLVGQDKGSISSDIWSLAITLLEFITEMDAWGLDDNGDDNADTDIMEYIKDKMMKKEEPPAISKASGKVIDIIRKCFNYASCERPTATQMLKQLD